MLQFISKIFGGNKSEKDIKNISHYVEEINGYFTSYASLSNDELRNKTNEFKSRIKQHISTVENEISELKQKAEELEFSEIMQKDEIYQQIDKLSKHRNEKIEEVLNEILPEAFAVVKETARRFANNTELVAMATELDRELSVKKQHITIDGDKVTYKNSWLAGGNLITWNMVHYDVQLLGGVVLHQGKIAEMATGEGKTLVSTLPAYLNALADQGVHIVTVNDYLAKRDSEWNGTLYEFLGLTVDCIDRHYPNSADRRKAYQASITYGTNNEFGFDYLRDNMVHNPDEMVQRKHHYGMVDEVDSVLIDDARTPLIISGPISKGGDDQQYIQLKPRVNQLVEAQKQVVNKALIDAKKLIAEGKDDIREGGLALLRAFRGLPKNTAIIKYLSEPGIRVKLQKVENFYMADQGKNMHIVDEELFFSY